MRNIPRLPRRERGVIMFIALIVLVAMSLTGIAIIRSVDSSVMVAGNLAFRQVAALATGNAVEQARVWLNGATPSTLFGDQPAVAGGVGYFAQMQVNFDLTGSDPLVSDFNWTSASVNVGTDANGNTVRYVIHRMCEAVGNPASVNCVRSEASTAGGTPAGEQKYGTLALPRVAQVLYRITTRVVGPRNTTSYVQVMVI